MVGREDAWLLVAGAMVIGGAIAMMALPVSYIIGINLFSLLLPLAFFAAIFLYKFKLPGQWPARAETRGVVEGLRMAGWSTEVVKEGLKVRLDRYATVRLILDGQGRLTGRYAIDATPAGYGVIIFLIILWALSPFSVLTVLYLALKERTFVRRFIPAIWKERGEERARDRIEDLTVDTLSELGRLSREAYESAMSDYEDMLILAGVVGLVLLVPSLLLYGPTYDLYHEHWAAMVITLAGPVLVSAALMALVRRRYRPKVVRTGAWLARVDESLNAEIAGREEDGSTVELMIDALPEVPVWLDLRERAMMFRHPAVSLLIVACFIAAGTLAFASCSPIITGDLLTSTGLVVAAVVAVSAGLWALLWQKRADRRESERLRKESAERLEKLRSLMETSLGGP